MTQEDMSAGSLHHSQAESCWTRAIPGSALRLTRPRRQPQAAKDSEFAVEAVDHCLVLLLRRQRQTGRWSEAEDQGKGIVYRSELLGIKTPRGPPKSLWIYHRSLLDEDSRLGPVE
jgi:hypothetical protein